MSMKEFWQSVRAAASFYKYGGPPPDAAPIDAAIIDKGLRNSTNWLTSRTMTGWDEANVDEYFTPADRDRLVQAVHTFQAVTKPLNPYRPAPTAEQIETARPALAEIIHLLEFDRYADADAFTTGKRMVLALASNPPPELAELVELRFNTGDDWAGYPGIWISAFLSVTACGTDDVLMGHSREIRPILQDLSEKIDPVRFPFVSFESINRSEASGALEAVT